jgi:hypothetical protein
VANIDKDGLGALPTVTAVAKAVHRMSAFSQFTSKLLGAATLAGNIEHISSTGVHLLQAGTTAVDAWGVTNGIGEQMANLTGPLDWVRDKNGRIYWDPNANSQSTTKVGENYLGKTLTFKFVSYIDSKYWDGPLGNLTTGIKLTSIIYYTGNENSSGLLTGISVGKHVKIGHTLIGKARGYYPGLGNNQNMFKLHSQFRNVYLNFEQHASVSLIEELGMHKMGYNIVNVAQQLNINYINRYLSISSATDLFPSATLSLNGNIIMQYNQPSFKSNFELPIIGNTISSYPYSYSQPIYDYSLKPAIWYKR